MPYTKGRAFHIPAVWTDPNPIMILQFCKNLIGIPIKRVYRSDTVCRGLRNELKRKFLDLLPEILCLGSNTRDLGLRASLSFNLFEPRVDLYENADRRRKRRLPSFHILQHISKIKIHGLYLPGAYTFHGA